MIIGQFRYTFVLGWMIGFACIATLVGFSILFAQDSDRPGSRPTWSITIGLGSVAVDGMQNIDGHDADCEGTVDRTDLLTVECRKEWEVRDDGEAVEYEPQVVSVSRVPGLFGFVHDRVGLARGTAVYQDWIDTVGWERFYFRLAHQPEGRWVEGGRTRLHRCTDPIEIIPDPDVRSRFRATPNSRSEVAFISGCDDQFTRNWMAGKNEAARVIRRSAGLSEGAGPLVL